MTDSSYTHISVLSDRSGSMESIRADAEGGINTFIREQQETTRKIKGGRATLTLAEFDDQFDYIYNFVDLAEVRSPAYKLLPRGGTALIDSMVRLINATGQQLANLPEPLRPGAVIFVTTTDGEENSSHESTAAQLKTLVKKQTKQFNWNFVFLAANQDAFHAADLYGFNKGLTVNFAASAAGTRAAYASTSNNVSGLRSAVGSGVSLAAAGSNLTYSDDDRKDALSN